MRPRHRSKSMRRLKRRTPSGKRVMHFKRRKPKRARCYMCNSLLHGVSRNVASKVRGKAKTKKRPERKFGGVLCARCSREEIKQAVRKHTEKKPEKMKKQKK